MARRQPKEVRRSEDKEVTVPVDTTSTGGLNAPTGGNSVAPTPVPAYASPVTQPPPAAAYTSPVPQPTPAAAAYTSSMPQPTPAPAYTGSMTTSTPAPAYANSATPPAGQLV